MSRIGYEKLSSSKETRAIRVDAIASLTKADLSQKNHNIFFRKASRIEGYLKSARKYEASADIALDLLELEMRHLNRQSKLKSDSKTGLLLLNEIWRYGNQEEIAEMKTYLQGMPKNCQIKFYEKACLIVDERSKNTPEEVKSFALSL